MGEHRGTIFGSAITAQVNNFTKFAVLADPQTGEQPPVTNLSDVTGNWAEANLNKLIAAGAIGGYPDGTFKPGDRITRAEFATVLVKAFKLEPQSGKVFTDTDGH